MKRSLLALLVCAAAMFGCGNDDAAEPVSNQEAIEAAATEDANQVDVTEQLLTELRARENEYGSVEYRAPGASDTCSVVVVLATPDEIELYEGAGDTIMKSPDGQVGVKISSVAGDEKACLEAADQALQKVGK